MVGLKWKKETNVRLDVKKILLSEWLVLGFCDIHLLREQTGELFFYKGASIEINVD